jgi:hypothetical protein
MWLKMYLDDLYVDKVSVEFEGMDTAKEKQRHLEGLAAGLVEENRFEILSSGVHPKFYIHYPSGMNHGLGLQTWKEIISAVGSKEAKNNIETLSKNLSYKTVEEET